MATLKKTAFDILNNIQYQWNKKGSLSISIRKITSDSRKVEKGDMFIAIRGPLQDGHTYLDDAARRGASVVVVETGCRQVDDLSIPCVFVSDSKQAFQAVLLNYFKDSLREIRLLGITGTNGKTTTAYLIHHLLSRLSNCGMIGTVEYVWNSHRQKANNTTPGLEQFLELLQLMVSEGVKYCVSEVSSHALDQGRVKGLRFETAVFTNLTQDHLDYHKDFEHYFQSKRKLFTDQPAPDCSIINIDDLYGLRLYQELSSKKISFGMKSNASYQIKNVQTSLSGSEFELTNREECHEIKIQLPLLHNIYNVAGALLAARESGFAIPNLIEGLRDFSGVPGRMQAIRAGQAFDVFVDYAHTPDAFQNVFESIRPHVKNKLITVFGCGGNRDKAKRPLMGGLAVQNSDMVFLTNDNPRRENPKEILLDIKRGFSALTKTHIKEIEDRQEAIEVALKSAEPGDVVLILGKGHEVEQIIGERTFPFSDIEVASKFLSKRKVVSA